MSEAGASTSKCEVSSDVDVEAATLLSQGRRNLLVNDAPSAVQSLEEAAALLGAKYGELANECGETYYFYGWALLELSRMETGVLGNALDGVPEEEQGDSDGEADNIESPDKVEEKEREQIFHDVQDALESKDEADKKNEKEEGNKESASEKEDDMTESGKEATDKEDATDKKDGTDKDKDKATDKEEAKDKDVTAGDKKDKDADKQKKDETNDEKETPMDVAEEDKKDETKVGEGKDDSKDKEQGKDEGAGPSEEKAEGGDGDEEEEEDDDDEDGEEKAEGGEEAKEEEVSNFQLSWEMLELARVIFSKQEADNKEFKLKVSQVYLKLGELGLETGQYAQSIEDFTQCLTRQKEQLEEDSRLLAETYYNLALAYSFDQKFDKAIESFEQSTVVIKNRIATLKKKAENPTEKQSEEDLLHDQKEMKELELLIPEIKVKIEDAKAEKNSAETAAGQAKTSASTKFDLGASSSSSSSGFAPCSSSAQAKPIAVRKVPDAKPDDVSHLVHRKRKSEEEADKESAGKKSRSEEGGGDATAPNGINGVNNSSEKIVPNGDTEHSLGKPEIKVKQVETTSNGTSEPAVMET